MTCDIVDRQTPTMRAYGGRNTSCTVGVTADGTVTSTCTLTESL